MYSNRLIAAWLLTTQIQHPDGEQLCENFAQNYPSRDGIAITTAASLSAVAFVSRINVRRREGYRRLKAEDTRALGQTCFAE